LDTRDLLTAQDTESADKPPPVCLFQQQVGPLARVALVVLLGRTSLEEDLHLGLDLLDGLVGILVDALQGTEGLFVPLFRGQPTGRFGNDKRKAKDEEGDDEDKCDGETVGKGVGVVLGALADTRANDLFG
jgi:hypothetical protein